MARIVCISWNESIMSLLLKVSDNCLVVCRSSCVPYHFEEEGQLNFGSSRLK